MISLSTNPSDILQRRYKCFYKKAEYIASFGNIKNLRDFEEKYMENPKKEGASFKKFIKQQIEKRNYNLDIFWILHEETEMELFDPSQLQQNLHKILNQPFNQSRLLKINWNQNKVMLSGFRSD